MAKKGKAMRTSVVTGEVLECQRSSTNQVWGDGAHVYSALSSSTDLFVRDARGHEKRISLGTDLPCRTGHEIVVVYIDAGYGEEPAALYNSTIDEAWFFPVGAAQGLKRATAVILLLLGAAILGTGAIMSLAILTSHREMVGPALLVSAIGAAVIFLAHRISLGPSRAVRAQADQALRPYRSQTSSR